MDKIRDKFWTSILNIFRIPIYVYVDNLHSSSTEELLYILLEQLQNLTTNFPDIEDDANRFINICAKYLRDTALIFFHSIIN